MNRENFSEIKTNNNSDHTTYYALAASTTGDKVKIYKYAFERINNEYRHRIFTTSDPIDKAIIGYEWAEFILANLPHYSADRSSLYDKAKRIFIHSFSEAQEAKYVAKIDLQDAIRQLSDLQKHEYSQSCGIQYKLYQTIGHVKRCRKQYDNIMAKCPDTLFAKMQKRAEEFEHHFS